MRKYMPMILMLLGGIGFVGFSFFLFPNKHKKFTQVYVADRIEIVEKDNLVIYEPYEEKEKNYIEVIKVKEMVLHLSGSVKINGVDADDTTLYIKGKNILLEANDVFVISEMDDVRVDTVNTESAVDGLSITIGTVIGVLVVIWLSMSNLPKNFKFTVGLTMATIVVFLLSQILTDMFWVLLSADIGWMTGMVFYKDDNNV